MSLPAFEEAVDEASVYLETILPFLTDEQAAIIPNAWPTWTADWLYEVGDRVSYGSYAYKCHKGGKDNPQLLSNCREDEISFHIWNGLGASSVKSQAKPASAADSK